MSYVKHALGPQDVVRAYATAGTISGSAKLLGIDRRTLQRWLKKSPDLRAQLNLTDPAQAVSAVDQFTLDGEECSFTTPPNPDLGEIKHMISAHGLDPEDWIVVSITLNHWDAPVAGGDKQRMEQAKVTLRRAPQSIMATTARHVPAIKSKAFSVDKSRPTVAIVLGDHQAPYHDEGLHAASVGLVRHLAKHNLTDVVLLGDLMDLPDVSRHASRPGEVEAQACIDSGYRILRDLAEAAPGARRRLIPGNHDERIEAYQLREAERLYGIRPADDGTAQLPALSLPSLLHLGTLGWEFVGDERGYEHAEVELISGREGLVIRHGWLTGHKTAEKTLKARGRSIITGHIHKRESVYVWDPSADCERQAHSIGTMSQVRSIYPGYMTADLWTQGLATVTSFPSGRFVVDHAFYDAASETLTWRDLTLTP